MSSHSCALGLWTLIIPYEGGTLIFFFLYLRQLQGRELGPWSRGGDQERSPWSREGDVVGRGSPAGRRSQGGREDAWPFFCHPSGCPSGPGQFPPFPNDTLLCLFSHGKENRLRGLSKLLKITEWRSQDWNPDLSAWLKIFLSLQCSPKKGCLLVSGYIGNLSIWPS